MLSHNISHHNEDGNLGQYPIYRISLSHQPPVEMAFYLTSFSHDSCTLVYLQAQNIASALLTSVSVRFNSIKGREGPRKHVLDMCLNL